MRLYSGQIPHMSSAAICYSTDTYLVAFSPLCHSLNRIQVRILNENARRTELEFVYIATAHRRYGD